MKRHLDGRVERFDCALVRSGRHVLIARFDHPRGRRIGGVRVPAGSRTFGYFWRRRPYLLYQFTSPGGAVLASRFDVVQDVRLDAREVSYLDLLLDVWIPSGGQPSVEDEDEVKAAVRSGLLSGDQQRRIESTKALLLRDWRRIVREAVSP